MDVLIIGAGIVGTSIARELSRYQISVAVLEKEADVAMGATKANSAIVHGGYAESHNKIKGRLCYQGRKQFEQLNRELNFGFKAIGSLVLSFEKDAQSLEEIRENGIANGLSDLSILTGEEVRKIEPNVNKEVTFALRCSGAGVCSPFEMAIALAENALQNGAHFFLEQEVSSITKTEHGFITKTKQGESFASHYIVNAAGINAGEIAQLVGDSTIEIHPRSGEYIVLAKQKVPLVNSVLFQMPTKMGKGILVAPTVYGNYLLGPDAIDESKYDKDTHAERLFRIYQAALDTTDAIQLTQFIRSYAGVRAVSSTDDFIIEESGVKGFINVAGIQSPGLTSSPAIAQMVQKMLCESGLPMKPKEDFNPYRKPTYVAHEMLPVSELQKLLALEEGAVNRMVCRCEQVLEVSIRDAMTRGIPLTTVDAIKRRTRAGMGACQGAFCRPRTARLMSHITKRKIPPTTDAELQKLTRVTRAEMLEYAKKTHDKVNR